MIKTDPLAPRLSGIELEVSRRLTKINNSDRANSNGWTFLSKEIDRAKANGLVNRNWKLKTDTSCGGEIVSPPMFGDNLLKEMTTVCDAARKVSKQTGQPVTDGECGLHIHFDAGDFSAKAFSNLFILTQLAEIVFYVMYPNRRMEYCAPISLNMKQASRFRDITDVRAEWYRQENVIKREEGKKQKVYNAEFINSSSPGEYYDGTRYHGLNIHCYWRIGTVEFRYCEGTFDPAHIKAWYELCLSIVNTAVYLAEKDSTLEIDNYMASRNYDYLKSHFLNRGRFRKLLIMLSNLCGFSRVAVKLIIDRVRRFNPALLSKNPPIPTEIEVYNAGGYLFRNVETGNHYLHNGTKIKLDHPNAAGKVVVDVVFEDISAEYGSGYYRLLSSNPAFDVNLTMRIVRQGQIVNPWNNAAAPAPVPVDFTEHWDAEPYADEVIHLANNPAAQVNVFLHEPQAVIMPGTIAATNILPGTIAAINPQADVGPPPTAPDETTFNELDEWLPYEVVDETNEHEGS